MKNYLALTKPGIIFGNAITFIGGFTLASAGSIQYVLLLITLCGLSLVVGSACVFNNYIDKHADALMKRTQNRPLVKGTVKGSNALIFGTLLLIAGSLLLAANESFIPLAIALIGFVIYVTVYSFLKYHSSSATIVGSLAGAIPPVVGYTAVSHQLDLQALLLFLIVALWQMPHFFAIAIYRMEDYSNASIPVLPVKKGIAITKIHMFCYVLAFSCAVLTLSFFDYVGPIYFYILALLGLAWTCLSFYGFFTTNTKLWARRMFLFSLIIITTFCFTIPYEVKNVDTPSLTNSINRWPRTTEASDIAYRGT